MIASLLDRLRSLAPGALRSPIARQLGPRARSSRMAWDRGTIICVALLLLIGLVMVTSASIYLVGQSGDPLSYTKGQLLSAFLGMFFGGIALFIPIEKWERFGFWLLAVALLGLVVVLIPGVGHVVNGSRRWIHLGIFSFQWSEAARVLILLWLSGYLVRHEESFRNTAIGFLTPVGFVGLAAGLMLLEPDMGAAVVLVGVCLALMFIAGARLAHCAVVVAIVSVAFTLLVWFAPYRMKRVIGFTDPFQHAQDIGYQLAQSLIGIGRGEWFGIGLGESLQAKRYLPEAHTDFLFSILAEEFGFVGILVVVTLFMVLSIRALLLARRAMAQGKKFHAYVAGAFGLWIGMQSLVNMGVTMGVLPTKGLTLPLLSYGRSSLLMTLIWVGIMLRIYHEVVGVQRTVTRGPLAMSSAPGATAAEVAV
jgi:cell division protein FtsW